MAHTKEYSGFSSKLLDSPEVHWEANEEVDGVEEGPHFVHGRFVNERVVLELQQEAQQLVRCVRRFWRKLQSNCAAVTSRVLRSGAVVATKLTGKENKKVRRCSPVGQQCTAVGVCSIGAPLDPRKETFRLQTNALKGQEQAVFHKRIDTRQLF